MVESLSQAEISALLEVLESGAGGHSSRAFGRVTRAIPSQVKTYDFRRPDKFSKDQIRALHMIMDVFTRSWGTFMSAKLRTGVFLEVQSIEQITYEEFIHSLTTPTAVAVFSMDPLEGPALLEFKLPLAFTLIDRMLGGKGRGGELRRELTEIEQAIMSGIVGDMWSHLRTAFKDIVPVTPKLESLESNPQFVQIVPPSDIVLYVSITMRIGEMQDALVFCLPFILLEPALSRLSTEQFFAGRRETGTHAELIAHTLQAMPVAVRAELGTARLSVQEVLALNEGDIVRLDQRTRLPIRVYVQDRLKYLARPGQVGETLACEVTSVVEPPPPSPRPGR